METVQRVVLGSSSRWRRQVLLDAGIVHEVIAPDVDEKAIRAKDARVLTLAIASAKMLALVPRLRGGPAFIITADQVVDFNGEIREKPVDKEQLLGWYADYSRGAPVKLVTTVMVSRVGSRDDSLYRHHEVAVRYREVPRSAVRAAFQGGDVMHSCGGVIVDDPALRTYCAGLSGGEVADRRSSAMGLPLGPTLDMLQQLGYAR